MWILDGFHGMFNGGSYQIYHLVKYRENSLLENWPFSSLIYPLKMVMFHTYVNVYQRVKVLKAVKKEKS